MGTRHIVGVVKDGAWKIAQYGQWDGYPSGAGMGVLTFLHETNRDAFAKKLDELSWITDEKIEEINTKLQAQTVVLSRDYPELSRDTGCNILAMVRDSETPLVLRNESDFAADSLFCEWAYVIDLDKGTFEVFKGFNQSPLDPSDRFFYLTEKALADKNYRSEPYYPVRLVKSYPLDELPSTKQFARDFNNRDEEEDDEETSPVVEEPQETHFATVVLTMRADGGLRVHSPDVPGLHLSGADPTKIGEMIVPTLLELKKANG